VATALHLDIAGAAAVKIFLSVVSYATERKGKEEYLYSAILLSISKRSDMYHTVLPANYTMSAFPS